MVDREPTPGDWIDSDDRWQGDSTGAFPTAGVPDLRQDVRAETGDAAAVAEIVDYLAEVAEAEAAGDDDLLAAIDADGLDIEICGVRWLPNTR